MPSKCVSAAAAAQPGGGHTFRSRALELPLLSLTAAPKHVANLIPRITTDPAQEPPASASLVWDSSFSRKPGDSGHKASSGDTALVSCLESDITAWLGEIASSMGSPMLLFFPMLATSSHSF